MRQVHVRPEQILNYLDVQPEIYCQDLEDRLRMGSTLELSDQGGVMCIMNQSEYREWLTAVTNPGTLLIKGNAP